MEQSDNEHHQKAILEFLKAAGLLVQSDISGLAGQVIHRDLLVSQEKYDECKPKLVKLKEWMSSSRLSCLQSTAESSQRWPLLNAVRQLLKLHNFRMTPFRLSDGYSTDGKKKLKRFFLIETIKVADQSDEPDGKQADA
jgi:hypothetical protein